MDVDGTLFQLQIEKVLMLKGGFKFHTVLGSNKLGSYGEVVFILKD